MKKDLKTLKPKDENAPVPVEPRLLEIQRHAVNNDLEILKSETASCFFCRQTYSARKVNDWITDERGVTAICPECGMDAVVGDASGFALTHDDLKALNAAFYGEDYMEKHPQAARKYVTRYREGKITHKKANEALYRQYLALLVERGDEHAAYELGQLYEKGSEFTPADPKTAFTYYSIPAQGEDGEAFTRLGVLCESGALGKKDLKGAYECYAKAIAMGSLAGLLHFTDCYVNGVYVAKDERFAFWCLYDNWPLSYNALTASTGKDVNVFPQLSYRLGKMWEDGVGVKKDAKTALGFLLCAQFGYQLLLSAGPLDGEENAEYRDVSLRIERLGKALKFHRGDPVFDNDTWADSLMGDSDWPPLGPNRKSVFSPLGFDRAQGTFDFDITYEYPPLIIDLGNLFCGFAFGTLHWSFTDVADVTFGTSNLIDHVEGDSDTGWRLLAGPGPEAEAVATIVLTKPASSPRPILGKEIFKGKA